MQSGKTPRVGVLLGLTAAAGVLGVTVSAATAPSARADDYSEIAGAINSDFADGQAAFTTAFSDFGSNDFAQGLAALFSGVDDDFVSPTNNLVEGTVEALTNESISPGNAWLIGAPSSFSDALADAQGQISAGESLLGDVSGYLSSGEYGEATYFDLLGSDFVSVLPVEELLMGGLVSF